MVLGSDPQLAYEVGRRNKAALEEAIYQITGDRRLAKVLSLLAGNGRCAEIEEALIDILEWEELAWLYEPEGPPPRSKYRLLVEVVCHGRVPLESDLFESRLAGPGPEPLAEELEAEPL